MKHIFSKKFYVLTLLVLLVLPAGGGLGAEEFRAAGVEFHYYRPAKLSGPPRLLVLFGGRNWPGDQTLRTFGFQELADRWNAVLLSPSFHEGEYWEPAKGSGKQLQQAVALLERREKLRFTAINFYGYSAGGQCAGWFSFWWPGRVESWGAHGCGYFPGGPPPAEPAPALISCGRRDDGRFLNSQLFLYPYREAGGELLWKPLPGGHELTPEVLTLAKLFFAAVWSKKTPAAYGEDDTGRVVPAERRTAIDPEYRNPLFNEELERRWRQ